jgi:hypothetical protein
MGFGVAPQCSRNRCLARWTVWMPAHGRGGEQIERTRRKAWSRARSEVFVPFRHRSFAATCRFGVTSGRVPETLPTGRSHRRISYACRFRREATLEAVKRDARAANWLQ